MLALLTESVDLNLDNLLPDNPAIRRSPYGERGLKYRNYRNCAGFPCRSPYGERGLKLGVTVYAVVFGVSLFLRRAWIEMSLGSSYLTASLCRSPYGECGLK